MYESQDKYYKKNRERILQLRKKYYQDNKNGIVERSLKYYQDNKEKIKKYKDIYRKNNSEKIKKCNKIYRERILLTKKGRYRRYACDARRRNIKFNLTMEEFSFFWEKQCSYCGDQIKTIGLDRVQNNLGYEINNVVSCCTECNLIKRTMSREKFIDKCKKISVIN